MSIKQYVDTKSTLEKTIKMLKTGNTTDPHHIPLVQKKIAASNPY